jgi:ABC-type iron transport system FetAB permease component
MFLWLIGYFLSLIFEDNRKVAGLMLIVYGCSLAEAIIIKLQSRNNVLGWVMPANGE